jgi:predicted glycoside hydrolase/deacetylase ChbG (UPF0249 family)
LGYPDEARLLISNADDFGRSHASNAATLSALTEGVVSSTTLMVPCLWALHAMRLLAERPEVSFGVHLTVVCEAPHYRYAPLTSRDKVASLVDASGYFYMIDRIPQWLAQVRLSELEAEFRAQIEAVLVASLTPTHLDWHCLYNGGRADIFELTVQLAQEYGLAMRVFDRATGEALQRLGLPTNDHDVLDSYSLGIDDKAAWYTRELRELPRGVSEWVVHPALDTPEMQAIEPESWQVRTTDVAFLLSLEAREIIEEQGIVLLSYKPLQAVWQQQARQRTN